MGSAPAQAQRLYQRWLLFLPRFRIRSPNELDCPRDDVTIRLERSALQRLVDAEKRTLELPTAVCVASTLSAPVRTEVNHHISLTPPIPASSSEEAPPLPLPLLLLPPRRPVVLVPSSRARKYSCLFCA